MHITPAQAAAIVETAVNTPGPWEWVDSPAWGYSTLWNPETRQEVLVPGGRNEADSPEVWMGEEMTDADKALISAAPDLLAAAHRAMAALAANGAPNCEAVKELRAAIAKSTA